MAIGVVALVAIASRFVGLDRSPPAFWADEWLGACHLGCLAQEGQSSDGQVWPLFAWGGGGGFYTPVYLYFGMLWTKLFGLSIVSVRSIPGVFVTLTIVGVFLLGRRIGGARAGLWALLIASLSPWAFHFSRIAWDPPLAPAFVVWCCYCWLLRAPIVGGALCGVMAAGAMYSYPPQRIQVPLLFAAMFFVYLPVVRQRWKRIVAFSVTAGILTVPLLQWQFSPGSLGRTNGVAIFAKDYIAAHHAQFGTTKFLILTLFDNISLHLRPSFLFFAGDPNIRHSPQHFGELGLLEDLALLLGVYYVVGRLAGWRRTGQSQRPNHKQWRWFALGVAGLLTGILPAALTREGLPHALRAIGTWPFVCILGGGVLAHFEKRWLPLPKVCLVVALAHMGLYGWPYFREYPRLSREEFQTSTYEKVLMWDQASAADRDKLAREKPELVRYYLMARGTHRCLESEQERLRAVMH